MHTTLTRHTATACSTLVRALGTQTATRALASRLLHHAAPLHRRLPLGVESDAQPTGGKAGEASGAARDAREAAHSAKEAVQDRATQATTAIGRMARGVMEAARPLQSGARAETGGQRMEEGEAGQRNSSAAPGTAKTKTEGRIMAITDILRQEHEEVKVLYRQYLDSVDALVKTRKFYALEFVMARHSACERLVLYSWLRTLGSRIPHIRAVVDRFVEAHERVDRGLKIADKVQLGDPAWERQLHAVMQDFTEHAQEEEQQLMPLLEEHLTRGELLILGDKWEAAATLVTSRPHPLAPQEGVAGIAAHFLSKPLDALRDMATGRAEAIKEEEPKARKEAQKIVSQQQQQQQQQKAPQPDASANTP